MKQDNSLNTTRQAGGYSVPDKTPRKEDVSKLETVAADKRPLSRLNFILMAVSGLMIVLGFLLMTGGASDWGSFNEEIFSTRRIVVGPAIAFLGFIAMGVAIMYPSRKN